MSATRRLPRLLVSAALLLLALTFFFPMIWMVMSSFKTNADIFSAPFSPPSSIDFGRWVEAWEVGNLGQYAINSAIVTIVSLSAIVTVALLGEPTV